MNNPDKPRIGIDVGGTFIKAGVLEPTGNVVDIRGIHITPRQQTEAGMVDRLVELIGALSQGRDIALVGIGVPGVVDVGLGLVVQSPNFPQWNNFRVKERLQERISIPVEVENDVNAIAQGEACFGAGRHAESFICIALGTGCGGALVLNRAVWHGVDGMAGEIGHMTVEPRGYPCNCGNRGCLEQYASRVGLVNFLRASGEHPVDEAAVPLELARRATVGDPHALDAFYELGRYLGIAVASLLNVLNLKHVIICGGLAASFPLFRRAAESELRRRAFAAIARDVTLIRGELRENAGIYGAASLDR